MDSDSKQQKKRILPGTRDTHYVEVHDIGDTTHAINVDYIVVMTQDTANTYRVFLQGLPEPIQVDHENMQKISKVIGFSG